ncbi:MAG: hypothetical protein Q4G63_12340 [Bacteroidia bacterium]|nr:hypothetical protein [Bacteroidia bacterium]
MRQFIKLSAVLLICLIAFTACPVNTYNSVLVKNNSSKSITTYMGVISAEHGGSLYPDTLLPPIKLDGEIKPYSDRTYIYNYPHSRNKSDTLSFFIWDTELANAIAWDSIRLKNMILQRYDITYWELESLKWEISYPPSPKMRDIKMYPPYKEK